MKLNSYFGILVKEDYAEISLKQFLTDLLLKA